jgi:hypothetical protein
MKRQLTKRREYSAPKAEVVEVSVEMGFVLSGTTEDVGKDDEIEF